METSDFTSLKAYTSVNTFNWKIKIYNNSSCIWVRLLLSGELALYKEHFFCVITLHMEKHSPIWKPEWWNQNDETSFITKKEKWKFVWLKYFKGWLLIQHLNSSSEVTFIIIIHTIFYSSIVFIITYYYITYVITVILL